MTGRAHRERGIALVATAVWVVALLALTSIAVDVSRLALVSTEVQAIADSAALAGANALLTGGSATSAGRTVGGQNQADTPAPETITIEVGNYASNVFTNNGSPQNAVRATAVANDVEFILASIFGNGSATNVTKRATASIMCTGSGNVADLPIGISKCLMAQLAPGAAGCSSGALPSFTQIPNGSANSCLTSLTDLSASSSIERSYLPVECTGKAQNPSPAMSIGEQIRLQNGSDSALLQDIKACVSQGIRDFTFPVLDCPNGGSCPCTLTCSQSAPVAGFATIHIASVTATGGNKGINGSQICNARAPGGVAPGNGNCFGTGFVALVQ